MEKYNLDYKDRGYDSRNNRGTAADITLISKNRV